MNDLSYLGHSFLDFESTILIKPTGISALCDAYITYLMEFMNQISEVAIIFFIKRLVSHHILFSICLVIATKFKRWPVYGTLEVSKVHWYLDDNASLE